MDAGLRLSNCVSPERILEKRCIAEIELGLEGTVRTLQEQVDAAGRKATVAANTIRTLTQERDSAVTQLGVAYMMTEQLKVDNETLRAENEALKEENLKLDARIAQLTSGHENKTQEWQKREEGLRRKIHRRDETLQNLRAINENVDVSRLVERTGKTPSKTPSKTVAENRSDSGEQKCRVLDKDDTRMFDMSIRADPQRGPSTQTQPLEPVSKKVAGGSKHKRIIKYVVENDTSSSSASEYEIRTVKKNRDSQRDTSALEKAPLQKEREIRDVTNVSRIDVSLPLSSSSSPHANFMQTVELAQLRRILEEDRIARRSRNDQSKIADQPEEDDHAAPPEADATVASEVGKSIVLPRKSSMKDLTGRLSQRAEDTMHSQKAESTMHSQQHHDEVKLFFPDC